MGGGGCKVFNADCSYCASRVDTVLTAMDIAHIIAFLPVEAVLYRCSVSSISKIVLK